MQGTLLGGSAEHAQALVSGECRAIIARARGEADEVYEQLAASQADLSHEIGRLRAALEPLLRPDPLALPPDAEATCTRLAAKLAELARRVTRLEQRIARIKGLLATGT
ncbi:hypothetical protein HYH03_005023 [Edaphochlamys debaryana]|uniref:Biogenesis of lysosome-related organelles complex 1 subunit 7 n=1 Tax=Edaphochlamys debaryana TaxID=47281 RepID=A0A836C1Q5_9CHLO|nr:hypothetical protein HYH03_005023 [Edaphochlamys debaryana]|eukprot:KAG2497020.1 hypothetical protein HYH03_005023 [Edaphochlamys debaryana]